MLFLGSPFPDFEAETTEGRINFHQWMENKWAILFSHPRDYTPVCTSELAKMAELSGEFKRRNVKIIALSCDPLDDHRGWSNDILHCCNRPMRSLPFPIIDDHTRSIARQLGMLDADDEDENMRGVPVTCRAVFVIGPDKKIKLSILYPATTGRDFNEIIRVVDSLQLTETRHLATPANWRPGDPCMVQPYLNEAQAREAFPTFETLPVPSRLGYMRIVREYQGGGGGRGGGGHA